MFNKGLAPIGLIKQKPDSINIGEIYQIPFYAGFGMLAGISTIGYGITFATIFNHLVIIKKVPESSGIFSTIKDNPGTVNLYRDDISILCIQNNWNKAIRPTLLLFTSGDTSLE